MGFAIAGAVIGIGAKVGSAYLESKAAQSAAGKQIDALNNLKPIDVSAENKVASDQDLARYKADFAAQNENDPQFASLRNQGAQGILSALAADKTGDQSSDTALKQISDGVNKNDPATQAVISQLISRAKADLDAGATLPPEFQAELVRSGLEKAGAAGNSVEGAGAGGTGIRQLLGSQGIALQQSRENQARTNVGTAEGLQAQRASILSELATLDNNLRGAKVQRAAGAVALGSAAMPAIGLSGADNVNLDLKNLDQSNQRTLAIGGLNAQKELAQGQFLSNTVGAVGSGLSSALGGMGGMGGGAAGGVSAGGAGGSGAGGFSGIGSWIGGLLGGSGGAGGVSSSNLPVNNGITQVMPY